MISRKGVGDPGMLEQNPRIAYGSLSLGDAMLILNSSALSLLLSGCGVTGDGDGDNGPGGAAVSAEQTACLGYYNAFLACFPDEDTGPSTPPEAACNETVAGMKDAGMSTGEMTGFFGCLEQLHKGLACDDSTENLVAWSEGWVNCCDQHVTVRTEAVWNYTLCSYE